MESKTYERGSFTISNQTMHIAGMTVNLANIDNMDFFNYKRHSYFSGLKEWCIVFIILLIIGSIWRNMMWIGELYLLSIVILIAYNIYEHQKKYFGLEIQTGRKTIYIKSDSNDFINLIHDTIVDAMESKKASYTINLDSHDVINNGIINKGNNNKNQVENKK